MKSEKSRFGRGSPNLHKRGLFVIIHRKEVRI